MTYLAQETSVEAGQPVELYEIRMGAQAFDLTSAEDDITVASVTYTAVEVERSTILIGPEERADIVQFTLPGDDPFALQYINNVPGQRAVVTIKRLHRTDVGEETVVIFKGIVQTVGFTKDGSEAVVSLMPLTKALSRAIPRFSYQGLCNHILYDERCKIISNDFRFQGTVTVVSGADITVPGVTAEVDGFYNTGYVALGSSDFRLILDHVDDVLTLLLPFPTDVTDQAVDVFAGCKHDPTTCADKFVNFINYGGFFQVPLINIFQDGIGTT